MNSILKFGIFFIISTLILSAFGTYLSSIFGLMNYATGTLSTNSNTSLIFTSVLSYFGWFLDVLFLTGASGYTTLVTAPTVSIGGIAWVLSLVRFIFGLGIVILIASLIFGRIRN